MTIVRAIPTAAGRRDQNFLGRSTCRRACMCAWCSPGWPSAASASSDPAAPAAPRPPTSRAVSTATRIGVHRVHGDLPGFRGRVPRIPGTRKRNSAVLLGCPGGSPAVRLLPFSAAVVLLLACSCAPQNPRAEKDPLRPVAARRERPGRRPTQDRFANLNCNYKLYETKRNNSHPLITGLLYYSAFLLFTTEMAGIAFICIRKVTL